MNNSDRIKKKIARGHILASLNLVYPGSVNAGQMMGVMLGVDPQYTAELLNKDMHLLADKGYVKSFDSAGVRFFMLTANGKDIADGMSQDPTLEI